MILRHLSTGVYWITFLYFINYTIDILIQIEKECKKKQMDNFMKIHLPRLLWLFMLLWVFLFH